MGDPRRLSRLTLLSQFLLVIVIGVNYGQVASIGVNYGRVASNLQPATQVAKFLKEATIINCVRLYDSDPETTMAFANTGIAVTITVSNKDIPGLTNLTSAHEWVLSSVSPLVSGGANIIRILVGNEVLSTANKLLILSLVPAMQSLHTALASENLHRIQVSTPHSLGLLSVSIPPSSATFLPGYDTHVIKPLLAFLRATSSPFMVNPYPFFGCTPDTLDFALFRSSRGQMFYDELSNRSYTNMLDAQLDAVFSAMSAAGYADVEIVIAETGWPSSGDPDQVGVDPESAAEYNGRLIQHVSSGVGTPLMPNRRFETYVFSLFDEDLKPGPTCERSFGLFKLDLSPSYDAGLLRRPNPKVESDAASSIASYRYGFLLITLILVLTVFWVT